MFLLIILLSWRANIGHTEVIDGETGAYDSTLKIEVFVLVLLVWWLLTIPRGLQLGYLKFSPRLTKRAVLKTGQSSKQKLLRVKFASATRRATVELLVAVTGQMWRA